MTLRVEDREAIRDVIAAYAHAIDRRRWDMMERIFHADAMFGFGSIEGSWRSFVDQARAIIDPCTSTQHLLGQTMIAFDGDDAADAETYMTAMHVVPPGYPVPDVFPDRSESYSATIAGRYIDRFERRGTEWRIVRRQGVYDWREYRPIGEASLASLPESARGFHDDRDPSTFVTRGWRT